MAALDEEEEEEDDENEEGERKQMEVKAHQASHTKYLMIRGYCNPGIGRGFYLKIGFWQWFFLRGVFFFFKWGISVFIFCCSQ